MQLMQETITATNMCRTACIGTAAQQKCLNDCFSEFYASHGPNSSKKRSVGSVKECPFMKQNARKKFLKKK